MCRAKSDPNYRRCRSSIARSKGGTRGGQASLDASLDLSDAMARAEADAAAHAVWLAGPPPPSKLEIELAAIGLGGLDARYGIDHTAHLTRSNLSELDVPVLPKEAGALDGVVLAAAAPGTTWTPTTGLLMLWNGQGDVAAREAYRERLGAWFVDFFAALRTRIGVA